MSDVKCPYCETDQEINHDDGYGYEEGEDHEQYCTSCSKEFIFTTEISFSYQVMCQKGDHVMKRYRDKWNPMSHCENCDHYERIEPEEKGGDV